RDLTPDTRTSRLHLGGELAGRAGVTLVLGGDLDIRRPDHLLVVGVTRDTTVFLDERLGVLSLGGAGSKEQGGEGDVREFHGVSVEKACVGSYEWRAIVPKRCSDRHQARYPQRADRGRVDIGKLAPASASR